MIHSPTITADVTFLTRQDGGRVHLPNLAACAYRPHLVVQEPTVRAPVVVGNHLTEQYLDVCFVDGPENTTASIPLRCVLSLVYAPQVDYSALLFGATFTIREGPEIVGFGTVVEPNE